MAKQKWPARRYVFVLHIVVGLALLSWLSAGPMGFEAGRVVAILEAYDFRWIVVPLVAFIWAIPILLIAGFLEAKRTGFEMLDLRERVTKVLAGRGIPVKVDVDATVPVHFSDTIEVPFELDANLAFSDEIDIEGEIPIEAEIPLDTEIETKVLGIGMLRIPIRAMVPVDLILPIKARMRIRVDKFPVRLREKVRVQMPDLQLPVKCRVDTRIDLLSNMPLLGRKHEASEHREASDPGAPRPPAPPDPAAGS